MGYKKELEKIAAAKVERYVFSAGNQPKVDMKIVSKIERIQPTFAGFNAEGEIKWEGRDMARWQMELIRVTPQWFGDFFMRWMELSKLESRDVEFRPQDNHIPSIAAKSQAHINELKIQHNKKGYWRKTNGD